MFKVLIGFIKDILAIANPWKVWMALLLIVNLGLLAVLALDSISLVIDAADVVRYWKGERTPTITV
jgi:hypothetical protein